MEPVKVNIITLSDRASQGIYEDKSGHVIETMIKEFFTDQNRSYVINRELLSDNKDDLHKSLLKSKEKEYHMVITTGGTGIGPRDITPEVIKPLLDKEITGIMEFIRTKFGAHFPNALISRSIAGIMGKTLVYALPGSPKAVKEYMEEILKTVAHSLDMVRGIQH